MDWAHKYTDAEIERLEKSLVQIYGQAQRDIEKKLDAFNKRFKVKDAIHRKELEDGKITKADYDSWLRGQVFQGQQWEQKRAECINVAENANARATAMINGKTHQVFGVNGNYMAYTLDIQANANFGFDLYDATTVNRLVMSDPQLLPKWKIDKKKDYIWNAKNVKLSVTQGIIQGEKLSDIAKRIAVGLSMKNGNKSKTFARTSMTGAQNAGRQTRLSEAKKMGINVKKEWMATLDGHTRYTHRLLDGQKVDIDKPFKVEGMEIDFPGDPTADASLVFNCRCTMVGDLEDFPDEYERYDNIEGKPIKGMTYTEWVAAKTKSKATPSVSAGVVMGKDISGTWTRRPDQFKFDIEDVINAQGFDGVPKVVSPEEFDKAVKESKFIAQRTYTAPGQETLDMYRNELYHGKWYVDCSTGGAQYGQGMYCASDYTGNLSDGIKDEMYHYRDLNESRIFAQIEDLKTESSFPKTYIETLTLDPSAKIFELKYKADAYETLSAIATDQTALNIGEQVGKRDAVQKVVDLRNEKQKNYEDYLEKRITSDQLYKMNDLLNSEIQKRYNDTDIKDIFNQATAKVAPLNPGSMAAMLGYDAIKAEGHGQSGSYTVILNRTKVIFKGE